MPAPPEILALCNAGPITRIARVGYAPFDIDDPVEITFADGGVHYVDVGVVGASDLRMGQGTILETAYGHLRAEEPDTWTNIARDWAHEALDLPWALGHRLANPRRLIMTNPYRLEVGYVFDVGGRELALFGEADLIFCAALDDPEIESFKLQLEML
jgi:hypothetical protein